MRPMCSFTGKECPAGCPADHGGECQAFSAAVAEQLRVAWEVETDDDVLERVNSAKTRAKDAGFL